MRTLTRTAALAAAVAIAATLAACAPADADPSTDAAGSTPPAAAPTSEPPAPAPTDDLPEGYYLVDDGMAAVPGRSGDGCEGLPGLEPRPNESPEGIGGYWYSELRDLGPIDHATGEATVDEHGQPVAYVAAEGDTMYAIAARFCIDYPGYLGQLNGIRRGDGDAHLFSLDQPLYPGDTINLDPYTIATVGDQNGHVFEHEVDYRIPEQR